MQCSAVPRGRGDALRGPEPASQNAPLACALPALPAPRPNRYRRSIKIGGPRAVFVSLCLILSSGVLSTVSVPHLQHACSHGRRKITVPQTLCGHTGSKPTRCAAGSTGFGQPCAAAPCPLPCPALPRRPADLHLFLEMAVRAAMNGPVD